MSLTISKARLFAELYLNGATRGDWNATAKAAGISSPSRGDPKIQKAFEELGQPQAVGVTPPDVIRIEPDPTRISPGEKAMLETPPPADESKDYWCEEAEKLKETLLAAARGDTKIQAAQARMIQHVMDRCYGVVGHDTSVVEPGIVILPTLGEASTAEVCPHCLAYHLGGHGDARTAEPV